VTNNSDGFKSIWISCFCQSPYRFSLLLQIGVGWLEGDADFENSQSLIVTIDLRQDICEIVRHLGISRTESKRLRKSQ